MSALTTFGALNSVATRRNLVQGAAGIGLSIPALGVFARGASANAPFVPLAAPHDGHVVIETGAAPEGFKLYDPKLPAVEAGPKEINVTAIDATLPVSKDVNFVSWTYNGTIPGPVFRVVEGDTIDFTFSIDPDALIGHSLDWHAARVSPSEHYYTISQGEELSYSFVAEYPGAFMYHCGTPPIVMHIAAGMHGALIVDPKEGWSDALEFVFVQSEYYLTDDGTGTDTMTTNYSKMLGNGAPDLTVFNGYANQYVENPIDVPVDAPIRVFVVNSGPNVWSSFHVVGTIFDRAYLNANPKNELHALQSISIGPGDGAMVEFTLKQPGHYPFVNHAFGHATSGAVGLFNAI